MVLAVFVVSQEQEKVFLEEGFESSFVVVRFGLGLLLREPVAVLGFLKAKQKQRFR